MKPSSRFRNGSRDDSRVRSGWKTATPSVPRTNRRRRGHRLLGWEWIPALEWCKLRIQRWKYIQRWLSRGGLKSARGSLRSLGSSSVVAFTFCAVFVQTIRFSCSSQHPPNPPSRLRGATPRAFHPNQSRNTSNRWWNRPPPPPPLAFIDPALRPSVSARCFRASEQPRSKPPRLLRLWRGLWFHFSLWLYVNKKSFFFH